MTFQEVLDLLTNLEYKKTVLETQRLCMKYKVTDSEREIMKADYLRMPIEFFSRPTKAIVKVLLERARRGYKVHREEEYRD